MSLVSLQESVKDELARSVKSVVKVYTFGGRFDLKQLRQYALSSPCLIVSTLGVKSVDIEGGQSSADLQLACFILGKNIKNADRLTVGLTLLEAVLGTVRPDQRWGEDAAHAPEAIRADNLFNAELDSNDVSLWAVTWTQGYDINVPDFTTLDDFLKYNSDWDLAPADDNTDAQDAVVLEAP